MKLHRDLLCKRLKIIHFYGPLLIDCKQNPIESLRSWQRALKAFKILKSVFGNHLEIHSFLLMSNHFHGILATQPAEFELVIVVLNEAFKEHALLSSSETIRLRPIENITDYFQTHRYIAYNPVSAHIVSDPFDYMFSSYSIFTGRSKLNAEPIQDALHLMLNPFRFLNERPRAAAENFNLGMT